MAATKRSAAGADGIAVISALFSVADVVEGAARLFARLFARER